MLDMNVFVEAFTEECRSGYTPVATEEEVRAALERASENYAIYDNGDGTLKVPNDWLSAMILEFGEWLERHRPHSDTADICRRYSDIPLVAELQKYDAGTIIEAVMKDLDGKGGVSQTNGQQAELLAEAIISVGDAMTLTYTTDSDYPVSVFLPKVDSAAPLSFADAVADERQLSPVQGQINHDLIYALCLQCLTSHEGALSICRHNGSEQGVSVVAFSEGRCWVLHHEMLIEMVNRLMDDDAALLDNLTSYAPSSEFEAKCIRLAACISGTLLDAVHDVKAAIMDCGGNGKFGIFSLCPPAFSVDLNGDVNAFLIPPELSESALPTLFDGIIELDPLMTGREASQIVAAAAVVRGASEILVYGNLEETSSGISDMSFFMELDSGQRPFDRAALASVSEFSLVLSDRQDEKLRLEMYKDLPPERKQAIDKVVNACKQRPDCHRVFIALEGDGSPRDESGDVAAFMTVMPANVSPALEEQGLLRLRANCVQCSFAPEMTAFAAFKPMMMTMNDPAIVSGMSWKGGLWSSLGADKTLEFLDSTNLGEVIEIYPDDPLDYREI